MISQKQINVEMKDSWEAKAETNAYHWVDSTKESWHDVEEYYKRGINEVEDKFIRPLESLGLKRKDFSHDYVLDIGCGTGRLTRALSTFFKYVVGTDISTKMIEIAKRDHADAKNVAFYEGNGTDLKDFKSNSFDFIFSFIVFQHIPSKDVIRSYLNEMYRTLKYEGVSRFQVRGYPGRLRKGLPSFIYFGFPNFYIAFDLKKGFIPVPVFRKYDTVYGAFFKQNELKRILESIGFTVLEIVQDNADQRYLWAVVKK